MTVNPAKHVAIAATVAASVAFVTIPARSGPGWSTPSAHVVLASGEPAGCTISGYSDVWLAPTEEPGGITPNLYGVQQVADLNSYVTTSAGAVSFPPQWSWDPPGGTADGVAPVDVSGQNSNGSYTNIGYVTSSGWIGQNPDPAKKGQWGIWTLGLPTPPTQVQITALDKSVTSPVAYGLLFAGAFATASWTYNPGGGASGVPWDQLNFPTSTSLPVGSKQVKWQVAYGFGGQETTANNTNSPVADASQGTFNWTAEEGGQVSTGGTGVPQPFSDFNPSAVYSVPIPPPTSPPAQVYSYGSGPIAWSAGTGMSEPDSPTTLVDTSTSPITQAWETWTAGPLNGVSNATANTGADVGYDIQSDPNLSTGTLSGDWPIGMTMWLDSQYEIPHYTCPTTTTTTTTTTTIPPAVSTCTTTGGTSGDGGWTLGGGGASQALADGNTNLVTFTASYHGTQNVVSSSVNPGGLSFYPQPDPGEGAHLDGGWMVLNSPYPYYGEARIAGTNGDSVNVHVKLNAASPLGEPYQLGLCATVNYTIEIPGVCPPPASTANGPPPSPAPCPPTYQNLSQAVQATWDVAGYQAMLQP